MAKLRWYQEEAVNATLDYFRSVKDGAACVVLPTGSGKTHVIAELCRQVVGWGGRAIVLAHVRNCSSRRQASWNYASILT